MYYSVRFDFSNKKTKMSIGQSQSATRTTLTVKKKKPLATLAALLLLATLTLGLGTGGSPLFGVEASDEHEDGGFAFGKHGDPTNDVKGGGGGSVQGLTSFLLSTLLHGQSVSPRRCSVEHKNR